MSGCEWLMAVILGGNGVGLAARALDAGACRTENSTSNPPIEVWRWRKCSLCTDIFYLTVCLIDGLQFNASWSVVGDVAGADVAFAAPPACEAWIRIARLRLLFHNRLFPEVEKTRISTIRASAMSHR